MGDVDMRLAGGRVFLPDLGLVEADVLISGGRIAGVVSPGTGTAAAEPVSVAGLVVLPGACDVHLHLGHGSDISKPRVPSDAATETAAAAVGGVTTFIPYVMSPDPYAAQFKELKRVTEAGARIDFGFHFVVATDAQLAELPRYIREFGVPTAKLFMNIRGTEGDRLGLPPVDDGFLFRLLEALRDNGGMLCPHPETIEIAWVLRDRTLAADPDGKEGLATWNATRPPFVEADAIRRATYLGRVVGTPVYTVHTSSAEALAAAVEQRRAGSRVTIETCTHYLTDDTTSDIGARGKVNPPLREPADREALWRGIAEGHVDTVGTDHIHRPITSKDGGIWKAQPGFPGLDTFLPAFLTEGHHKRGLPLETLVPLVTSKPADAMGLSPSKGRIVPGTDADFAIIDLDSAWTVGKEHLASDAGYSIYEGREMACRVVHTMVRGRFVVRDGALSDGCVGTGHFLPRELTA